MHLREDLGSSRFCHCCSPSRRMNPLRSLLRKDPRDLALNALIAVLAIVVAWLLYAFVVRHVLRPPVDTGRVGTSGREVIQIDVLNGSGLDGAATTCTAYLRSRGYDVVEMRNYKTFDVGESLVIDRAGNVENARKVAYALGIRKENVIQQINEEYFVDVSVLIGRDFRSLKPAQ